MSILVDKNTVVICQGMTGKMGTSLSLKCINYGTKIVAGVNPGKDGQTHIGLPIFGTVKSAVQSTGATASILFTPIQHTKNAIIEAIEANVKIIICITEGMPNIDILEVKELLDDSKSILIGPNTPGIISPSECLLGIMPSKVFYPGDIGIISRSGTLMYEAAKQISEAGLGQSTCIGIGGDYIVGIDYCQTLLMFENDPKTKAILLIGEVGGFEEIKAAKLIKQGQITKPVFAYIAGQYVPNDKRMGHAGAIASSPLETADTKISTLKESGAHIIDSVDKIGCKIRNSYL